MGRDLCWRPTHWHWCHFFEGCNLEVTVNTIQRGWNCSISKRADWDLWQLWLHWGQRWKLLCWCQRGGLNWSQSCRLCTKRSWLGWIRNNGCSISLGQLAGNLLCNTGHDLDDYVTRKYRQNVLTRATVSYRSLWLTANRTTSSWLSSGNTCFWVLVNSSGIVLSWLIDAWTTYGWPMVLPSTLYV